MLGTVCTRLECYHYSLEQISSFRINISETFQSMYRLIVSSPRILTDGSKIEEAVWAAAMHGGISIV